MSLYYVLYQNIFYIPLARTITATTTSISLCMDTIEDPSGLSVCVWSRFLLCVCVCFFTEGYYYYCFYRTQSHCTSTSRDRHSSRRLHLFRYLLYYYVYGYYIRYVYELGLRARYDCIRAKFSTQFIVKP